MLALPMAGLAVVAAAIVWNWRNTRTGHTVNPKRRIAPLLLSCAGSWIVMSSSA